MLNGRTVIAPREWLAQWLAMLDHRHPGWRRGYAEADFALAIEDVYGGELPAPAGEGDLELLADFALEPEGLLEGRPSLEFEYIFRASHGSSAGDPSLRRLRAEALRNVVRASLESAARRFARVEHAARMRDRRRARRHPRLEREDLVADVPAVGPETEALGREAADRVAARLREELAPGVQEALRCLLFEGATACEVAAGADVSPATMSRAFRRFRELAAVELDGCREAILGPFLGALARRLA